MLCGFHLLKYDVTTMVDSGYDTQTIRYTAYIQNQASLEI